MSYSVASGLQLRVLIVDDDPLLGDLFVDVLGISGDRGCVARTGDEALRLLNESRFDLVITDLHMPGISGLELWKRLQTLQPQLAENMIFMSGEVAGSSLWDFLSRNRLNGLRKPFQIEELLHLVQQVRTSLMNSRTDFTVY